VSAADLVRTMVGALDDAGVPHMLVGSFASSMHGAPRTTQDIDIVVDPTPEALDRFVSALDPHTIYVSPSAAEALVRRSQFDVIDLTSGWKDATAVLAVGGERLDGAYLDRWAAELGVVDLLARARAG
jgi:hypothetical protein